MPGAHIILPIWVDGEKVSKPDELKKYYVGTVTTPAGQTRNITLYSIYKKMPKEGLTKDYIEYVDLICRQNGLSNPFKISPLNTSSSSWSQRVRDLIDEYGTPEMIVPKLIEIAMSDDKNNIRAMELLGKWSGLNDTQKIELKGDVAVDANVNLNPELFDIPDGK